MKYILASLSLAVVLFILRDQLADLWQSITGTPHVCAGGDPSPTDDAGSDPIAEHPFFIEWQNGTGAVARGMGQQADRRHPV
jgi:hypothetical protein